MFMNYNDFKNKLDLKKLGCNFLLFIKFEEL